MTCSRVEMTLTDSSVVAITAIIGRSIAMWARTFETSVLIITEAILADTIWSVCILAFVYINSCAIVEFVAGFVFACISTISVNTNAIATRCSIWIGFIVTLVNVDAVSIVF